MQPAHEHTPKYRGLQVPDTVPRVMSGAKAAQDPRPLTPFPSLTSTPCHSPCPLRGLGRPDPNPDPQPLPPCISPPDHGRGDDADPQPPTLPRDRYHPPCTPSCHLSTATSLCAPANIGSGVGGRIISALTSVRSPCIKSTILRYQNKTGSKFRTLQLPSASTSKFSPPPPLTASRTPSTFTLYANTC